eukprot:3655846-Rhodomonas_salina.1
MYCEGATRARGSGRPAMSGAMCASKRPPQAVSMSIPSTATWSARVLLARMTSAMLSTQRCEE